MRTLKVLTVNFNVIRVNHGYNLVEGNMDFLTPSVHPQANSSSLSDTAEVVGFLLAVLGVPAHVVLVSQDSCSHGGAVVATQSNKHHAETRYAGVGLEEHRVGSGNCGVASVTEM